MKKKYVFAGASQRMLGMFALPMKNEFANEVELCGVYDINPGRADYVAKRCEMPAFYDFDEMLNTVKPDVVLVTTVDAYHSDYIIRSLEAGCDVVTEKPMTIDAKRCKDILDAEKKSGHKVTVTFNYRYAPFTTKIKEIIDSGILGDVFSVHFEWLLDRNMSYGAHGTSYFRRWNSRMAKSGGLLVHKSTHHFDMINWWIGQKPMKVSAFGKLNLYGAEGSKKYADGMRGTNCRNCEFADKCQFYYKLSDFEKEFYAANEDKDGYIKDNCIYADDIDIYDTMSLNVSYDNGTMMTYSLNATCAYEGWRVAINGSKGRLEAFLPETGPEVNPVYDAIKFYDLQGNVTEYRVTKAKGGHGGGDVRLRKMLFLENVPDPMGHAAGTMAGAESIMIGAAANVSIKEGRIVDIWELLGE
ncbi:MAG: Gfo/Idh/MocA family oxidoreductase [Oscillospiraceae bacterium]|nr:Gfo/Idh/MocA family oxidoreductase [Oscillospiraceae bacterium]